MKKSVRLICVSICFLVSSMGNALANDKFKLERINFTTGEVVFPIATKNSTTVNFESIPDILAHLNEFADLIKLESKSVKQEENNYTLNGYWYAVHQYVTLVIKRDVNQRYNLTLALTYAPFFKEHRYLLAPSEKKEVVFDFKKLRSIFSIITTVQAAAYSGCSNTDVNCLNDWIENKMSLNNREDFIDQNEVALVVNPKSVTTQNIYAKTPSLFIETLNVAISASTSGSYGLIVSGTKLLSEIIVRLKGASPNALPRLIQRYEDKHQAIASSLKALDLLISAENTNALEVLKSVHTELKIEEKLLEESLEDIFSNPEITAQCKANIVQNYESITEGVQNVGTIIDFLENKAGYNSNIDLCGSWDNLKRVFLGNIRELARNDELVDKGLERNKRRFKRDLKDLVQEMIKKCKFADGKTVKYVKTKYMECSIKN